MDVKAILEALINRQNLDMAQMTELMTAIMSGQLTEVQIAALLVALRMKGETVDEISAAAQVMRNLAVPVSVASDNVVDIVGTGGDGISTFNVSTACTFVVAAAGGKVAKHGNRSVSSQSGSADLLEFIGVKLDLSPEQVAQCIQQVGIGFMFAPLHHSAMKYAIAPRKQMGVRTLFNLLGPLTNPAQAQRQLLGVFAAHWVEPLAKVLKNLGSVHAMVVHSEDGLDEISISGTTSVSELKNGEVQSYEITPEQFGFSRRPVSDIVVKNPEQSWLLIKSALNNEDSAGRNIILLNAGAAIYVAGLTDSLSLGIQRASDVIASGAAWKKVQALVHLSESF